MGDRVGTGRSGRRIGRYIALLVLFTGIQFAAEWLGLSWAGGQGGLAAPVWIGTAVSVTIIFFGGYRYLPAIAAGAALSSIVSNIGAPLPLLALVGSAAASSAEAAVGASFLRRFDFQPTLGRLRDVLALVFGVGVVATAISATIGVGTLWASGVIGNHEFQTLWPEWWFANATSAIVLAPLILFAVDRVRARHRIVNVRIRAFFLSLSMLTAVSLLVFLVPRGPQLFVFPFVVFPFALYIALRFGPIGAIVSNALLAAIALLGTYQSVGPFGTHAAYIGETLADALLVTQVFAVTVAVTTLALAATIAERERVRERLRNAERQYRSLVEHVPAGIYLDAVDDPETGAVTPIYVSPQIEAMLGYTQADFVENVSLWQSLRHPDHRERALDADLHHYRSGEPLSQEATMIARDGRELWVREEAVLLTNIAGHDLVSQGVVVDITELMRSQKERERLREQMVNAQEEERRRIAADIHDDPIQGMTAVGLRLETLRRRLASGTLDDGAFEKLGRTIEQAVSRLRHLMFELRPPALDAHGLAAAIEGYLSQEAKDAGFAFELRNELVKEPDPAVRAGLYRIAQEALRNVMKHADAGRVAVTVGSADGGIMLRIEDNGKGIPEKAPPSGDHFGLAGIRERAAMMGGWARIESSPDEGTKVDVWIPA